MFYVLNFDNHEFISCDNASVAEANIRSLLATGLPMDSLEVINGFADGSHLSVHEFRTLCRELELIDESIINTSLSSAKIQREEEGEYINFRGYQSADDVEYPKYPHDFGNGYKVQTIYANLLPPEWVNEIGDEFDLKEDAEEMYPNHEIVVGFRVICEIEGHGSLPEDCDSFCKTIDEAISLYEEKILPQLSEIKLEVGMVGTIKNDPDIKKALRGKSFVITELDEHSLFASCSVEGNPGVYAVARYHMESVSMPADKLTSHLSLDNQIEAASSRTSKRPVEKQEKAIGLSHGR